MIDRQKIGKVKGTEALVLKIEDRRLSAYKTADD
jgi:hypothetical protein